MKSRHLIRPFLSLALCAFALYGSAARGVFAQQQAPLTSEELLQLVRQLPKRPGLKEEIISALRARGINFTLTRGIRSVVATRSGNDADLRRALEEAERRFLDPAAVAPPSAEEAAEVLEKARAATREAAEAMPDFVVKQLIRRASAYGTTKNWVSRDRLVVGVSYRAKGGEKYRLLAKNGIPIPAVEEKDDYVEAGGSSSTGEFVTVLSLLFADETKTEFKPVGTDTLRGRRTVVYEYTVKQPHSKHSLSYNRERTVVVGYRGRVWIDREHSRVLRLETVATDIPSDFPITATTNMVDYDWVTIQGQGDYLLPSRAVMEMTTQRGHQSQQSRNDIHFRGYQKYGSEVKVIEEDIIEEEEAPQKP